MTAGTGNAEPRYEDITETTDIPITREAASMLSTRYEFAAALAMGRRVLEIGCAAGQGLSLIGGTARSIVAGDYSATLLDKARFHYGNRFPFVRLSAEALPFHDSVFDAVLFFEATYYVPDMNAAFDEIHRVLTPGGIAIFVNANPERPDFVRSPHSIHYHTALEFREALAARHFAVVTEGAFPVVSSGSGPAARAITSGFSIARRALEALHLVPKTLRGRARLKRLVFGKLPTVPAELTAGFAAVAPRTPVVTAVVREYKVLYVTARKTA